MKDGTAEKGIALADVIGTAIQLPGVKVNREEFLRECFKKMDAERLGEVLENGPVSAQCPRGELQNIAQQLVQSRTLASTGMSFAAGLPGGFAMAAAIPADMAQFYGTALRLAQELAYLYGEGDLWTDEKPDSERITHQLMLYCGVMLGASGAAQTVRLLASSLSRQALKKLPQKALTKTLVYPIVKSIAKAFSVKMTKEVFAKGISKVVPVIGGLVSGGLTFASMRPMGMRLANAFDEANFAYSAADFEADWKDVMEVYEQQEGEESDAVESVAAEPSSDSLFAGISQAKQMLDASIISESEFAEIKAKLISEM